MVSANASDNVGVVGVQFKLDGANLGSEVLAPPYNVTWNSTSVANGPHTLTAAARDAAGNQTTATSMSVVSNSVILSLLTVNITSADTTATEGLSDTASFTLTRTGSTAADLIVNLAPTGTATKWDDYRRPVQGDMPDTWTIPAGSSSVTVTVMAVDDALVEGTETATLTIQPSPAYTVGTPSSVTLIINDKGSAGTSVPIHSIRKVSGGGMMLTWASTPGKIYRVVYKNNCSDPNWTNLGGNITAPGTATSYTDATASTSSQRFYAVYVTN
jgi:hypothetical protein